MIKDPSIHPVYDIDLCTLDEFFQYLNPFFAKTAYPDPNDIRPIWKFNIENGKNIFLKYGDSLRCRVKKHRRGKIQYYAPIHKTSNGCMFENTSPPYDKFEGTCTVKSTGLCCLMPEIIIGKTYFDTFEELEDEDLLPVLNERKGCALQLTDKETPITAPLVPFLNQCCVDGGEVDNSILKAQYRQWCIEHSQIEVSAKKFKMIMNCLGFTQKNNPERTWQNIQLFYN